LLAAVPGLSRAITCTTRPPREGERDGVDYHFLSSDAFAKLAAAGDFLESADVYGHRYGTLRREVDHRLDRGQDVLLNIDVQGAASVRRAAAADARLARALVTVFLAPPSLEVLAGRLRARGKDSETAIQHRLAAARAEIARWREFDFLVISTTVTEDLRRMQLLYEAEKMRTGRVIPPFSEDGSASA